MNVVRQEKSITLRPGVEEDAQAIYRLKREAFGASSLQFTIYQSEKTVAYIRHLIASESEIFVVAESSGELTGYANVGFAGNQPVLNYIAVSGGVRSCGLGKSLLKEAESRTLEKAYGTLMLDAFESNPRVLDWYEKSGYSVVSRSFLYRIDLASALRKDKGMPVDLPSWQFALDTEGHAGFSKVVVATTGGEITLGLIGGNACKLLGYRGISLDEAIATAAATVNGTRDELIVRSLEAPKRECHLLSLETVLRMVKKLHVNL
jgi:ribosomal protein S18 acetylase RimI-like enzyme